MAHFLYKLRFPLPQDLNLERWDRNRDGRRHLGPNVDIASLIPMYPQDLEECPEDRSSSVGQNPCLCAGMDRAHPLNPRPRSLEAQAGEGEGCGRRLRGSI